MQQRHPRVLAVLGSTLLVVLLASAATVAQAEPPGDERVYVANSGADTISVVDLGGKTVVASVPVGREPHQILAPPGGRLYVGIFGEDTVSVIDPVTMQELTRVRVGRNPTRLASTPTAAPCWPTASARAPRR